MNCQSIVKLFLKKGRGIMGKNKQKTKAAPYTEPECHSGNIKVFKDPSSNLVFYGGGSSREANPYKLGAESGLILDLADRFRPLAESYGVSLSNFEKLYHYHRISLDWPDSQAISLFRSEWEALLKDMRVHASKYETPVPVLVTCVGGHGRTGTCLSILAVLTGACDLKDKQEDVVAWIRSRYCKKAVESGTQIEYIEQLFECKIASEPSNAWRANAQRSFQGFSEEEMKKYGLVKEGNTWKYVGTSAEPYKHWDTTTPVGTPAGGPGLSKPGAHISTFLCLMCGGDLTYGTCEACGQKEAECSCVPTEGYGKEAYNKYFDEFDTP